MSQRWTSSKRFSRASRARCSWRVSSTRAVASETVSQPGHRLDSAFEPGEGSEPACAKTPPDPEADDVAGEAAEPADREQGAKAQRAGMRGVAREQPEKEAVRGRIGEHNAVGCIAVLAYEVEE